MRSNRSMLLAAALGGILAVAEHNEPKTTHVLVDTDNFDGDYPMETFVAGPETGKWARTTDPGKAVRYTEAVAKKWAEHFNGQNSEFHPRWIKVEPIGYVLNRREP